MVNIMRPTATCINSPSVIPFFTPQVLSELKDELPLHMSKVSGSTEVFVIWSGGDKIVNISLSGLQRHARFFSYNRLQLRLNKCFRY